VDKKTALALLDSAALPIGIRGKKKMDDEDEYKSKDVQMGGDGSTMNFTVITKRGNKQQVMFSAFFRLFVTLFCNESSDRLPFQQQRPLQSTPDQHSYKTK
jgi:hypothetical protein